MAQGPDVTLDPARSNEAKCGRRRRELRPRDADRTKRDILSAAGKRFARNGYTRVTLKEIADDVGVTPALVVRYYHSKRELFEAFLDELDIPLVPLPEGVEGEEQLLSRSRQIVAYFLDEGARGPGVAMMRSLDVDDGAMFRSELENRIYRPWSPEVKGANAELRLRLIASVLIGVGMIGLGALVDPDGRTLDEGEADTMAHYLARLIAVCRDAP